MSLEKVVRPFQSTVSPVRVNPAAKPTPNVIVRYGESGPGGDAVNSDGDPVPKTLSGSLSLSATVYNKKHPKERKKGQTILTNQFSDAQASLAGQIFNAINVFGP